MNILKQLLNQPQLIIQLIKENKLIIHSKYFQCRTLEDLEFHRQRLHCTASLEKFIYRIIESRYNNTTYCGHHWKIKKLLNGDEHNGI